MTLKYFSFSVPDQRQIALAKIVAVSGSTDLHWDFSSFSWLWVALLVSFFALHFSYAQSWIIKYAGTLGGATLGSIALAGSPTSHLTAGLLMTGKKKNSPFSFDNGKLQKLSAKVSLFPGAGLTSSPCFKLKRNFLLIEIITISSNSKTLRVKKNFSHSSNASGWFSISRKTFPVLSLSSLPPRSCRCRKQKANKILL